jgi:hypothetical protein
VILQKNVPRLRFAALGPSKTLDRAGTSYSQLAQRSRLIRSIRLVMSFVLSGIAYSADQVHASRQRRRSAFPTRAAFPHSRRSEALHGKLSCRRSGHRR